MLQWNPQTGSYEATVDGYTVEVPGDDMSEAKDAYARERFGVNYADTDDAQSAQTDAELESIVGWSDYMVREAAK